MRSLPENYNPFISIEYSIPKKRREFLSNIKDKDITLTKDLPPFESFKEAWLLCVALGVRKGRRVKLSEEGDSVKIGSCAYIKDPDVIGFLISVGISELCIPDKTTPEDLFSPAELLAKDPGKIIRICEEYAVAGASVLEEMIGEGTLSSLENLAFNLVEGILPFEVETDAE